jgi:hypothetical protein
MLVFEVAIAVSDVLCFDSGVFCVGKCGLVLIVVVCWCLCCVGASSSLKSCLIACQDNRFVIADECALYIR